MPTDAHVHVYPYPGELPAAADFTLTANGRPIHVHDTEVGAWANFGVAGAVDVEVTTTIPFERVRVRPLSRGVEPVVSGQTVRLHLDGPATLSVEFDDRLRRPLLLFADAPEEEPPRPDDPNVRYFAGGRVHDAGVVEARSGETIYLAPGAVVRGAVYATDLAGVRVLGRGVLDGRGFDRHACNMLRLLRCRDVVVDGVTIVGSPGWTVVPVACDDVRLSNLRLVNWRDNDDGIDVVGSQRVAVDGCFVRTKDDCVAIKALANIDPAGMRDVADVRVTRSVFWNAQWGNALEIGFETRCNAIRGVTFADCDVIHCEYEGYYSGGVFTIHNGDRATVSDVLYEDVRVEDAREKLIDFKVLHSHYSKDAERGQIRGVHLKDVSVVDGPFPPSVIQSFDREHLVQDVTVENLRVHGRAITSQLDARMIVERARNVRFVTGAGA